MAPRHKSIETKHYEERDGFFTDLARLGHLDRRAFMKIAGISAGIPCSINRAQIRGNAFTPM